MSLWRNTGNQRDPVSTVDLSIQNARVYNYKRNFFFFILMLNKKKKIKKARNCVSLANWQRYV